MVKAKVLTQNLPGSHYINPPITGKGGKNRRRGKGDGEESKRELEFKEDGTSITLRICRGAASLCTFEIMSSFFVPYIFLPHFLLNGCNTRQ